mgnify:CR=1 FL=1|jgi:hypothetical protein
MPTNLNAKRPFLKSMVTCLSKVVSDGFKEDFKATSGGLRSTSSDKVYAPDQVRVINSFRFEGFSNPDDNAVLYLLETNDGLKGTLVDAYGAYADPLVYNFFLKVQSGDKLEH